MTGEIGIMRIELHILVWKVVKNSSLAVINHELFGNPAKVFKCIAMALQEMLEFFRKSKFSVHQSAITQDHNKDTEIPLGIADGNRATMPQSA